MKATKISYEGYAIEDALDEVIRCARVAKGAEIDAGACGTRSDFQKMREAQSEAAEAKDAFLQVFVPLSAA